MKIKRRTEITIETEKFSATATTARQNVFADCAACARRVRFLKVDEAARVSGTTARGIFRLVENEKLHFRETPDGALLVCAVSLTAIEPD